MRSTDPFRDDADPDTPTVARRLPQHASHVFSAPETGLAFRNHGMHAKCLRESITPLGSH